MLFFSPKMEYIEDIMQRLREGGGLDLDKEDDVARFLGVSINRQEDATILMTQSGLATKIVDAFYLMARGLLHMDISYEAHLLNK